MTLQQWVTYCVAVFLGGIIPGPIMLLAMTAGARHGIVSALPAAMGNVVASIIQVLVSLTLVSVIAQNIDALFVVMMTAGGAYLIYLGLALYRANPFNFDASMASASSKRGDFVNVFLVTLMNPKALMFFIALFPQVIPKDDYSISLVVSMTLSFAVIALICFVIYAAFGTGVKWVASRSGVADVFNLALSATFIGLGLWAIYNAMFGS